MVRVVVRMVMVSGALVLGCAAGFATDQTVELRGRVVEVNGFDVRIELDSAGLPRPGDAVDLRFVLPDGDELSVGTWRVTDVVGNTVSATVVQYTGRPSPGYIAVIAASLTGASPPPTAPPQAWPSIQPPSPTAPPPAPAVEPARQPSSAALSSEARQLLDALRSIDPAARQRAAKALYRNHRSEALVLEEVNRVLLEQYNLVTGDAVHMDAMAHLCNILGASQNSSYASTLRKVQDTTKNGKLRKYAAKNLRRLG